MLLLFFIHFLRQIHLHVFQHYVHHYKHLLNIYYQLLLHIHLFSHVFVQLIHQVMTVLLSYLILPIVRFMHVHQMVVRKILLVSIYIYVHRSYYLIDVVNDPMIVHYLIHLIPNTIDELLLNVV